MKSVDTIRWPLTITPLAGGQRAVDVVLVRGEHQCVAGGVGRPGVDQAQVGAVGLDHALSAAGLEGIVDLGEEPFFRVLGRQRAADQRTRGQERQPQRSREQALDQREHAPALDLEAAAPQRAAHHPRRPRRRVAVPGERNDRLADQSQVDQRQVHSRQRGSDELEARVAAGELPAQLVVHRRRHRLQIAGVDAHPRPHESPDRLGQRHALVGRALVHPRQPGLDQPPPGVQRASEGSSWSRSWRLRNLPLALRGRSSVRSQK